MTAWIAIVAAGLGSYLLRISMVALAARGALPASLERVAALAVPAAFAALATAGVVHQAGAGVVAPVGAVVAGALAARRTGRSDAALVVGMPVLWLLGALLG